MTKLLSDEELYEAVDRLKYSSSTKDTVDLINTQKRLYAESEDQMSFKRDHSINNEQEEIMTYKEEKSNALNEQTPLEGQTHIDEAKKAIRVDELLCDECNLIRMGSMVGHGFTDYVCKGCNETISYHNTGTPTMCKPCAIEALKCQRCMRNIVVKFI